MNETWMFDYTFDFCQQKKYIKYKKVAKIKQSSDKQIKSTSNLYLTFDDKTQKLYK